MPLGTDRWLIRLLIPSLAREYKTISRALKYVREIGLKIRTETFYKDWHEITAWPSQREKIAKYAPDKALPEDAFLETAYRLRYKYQYVGEYEFISRITGEREKIIVSFGDWRRLRPETVERRFKEMLSNLEESYKVKRSIGVRFIGARRRAE